MAGRTLWDQLIAGTGDAITDIRQKLVEEPWYGRTLDMTASNPAWDGVLHPPPEKDQSLTPTIEHRPNIDR